MAEWRAGRSTGRTLWRDEQLVGMVDSPEVASEIVETMNRGERLLVEVERQTGRKRSLAAADCPECNRRIWLADGRLIPHPPDDDPQSSLCRGSLRTPDAQRRREPEGDCDDTCTVHATCRPETGRGRSPAGPTPPRDHIAGVTGCDCSMCRAAQPRDAQRRSEATPKNDLQAFCVGCGRHVALDVDGRLVAHHLGQRHCAGSRQKPEAMAAVAPLLPKLGIDLARVDPYDTTKGFTPKNGEHPE